MGYETISGGEYAPTKYIRYTQPEERELKPSEQVLKKDEFIEGYFLKSYSREFKGEERWNHVIVGEDNVHYVIPDNKDVTKAFTSGRMVVGAKTRFTYLGKVPFKTKTGQTARAVKALVQQDKASIVEFEGDNGNESIKGSKPAMATAQTQAAPITQADVPF
jgi:DUF4097 and DUF4098 domain-containing protein YvlB